MKKIILVFLLFGFIIPLKAQINPSGEIEKNILAIMDKQEKAWNRADIEGFMQDYWQSEELKFIGKNGITKGWQATLDRYKKSYPNQEAMGTLKFEILQIEVLSKTSAFVIGKWNLKRTADELSGHFTLLWKKIKGKWVIVADHSS